MKKSIIEIFILCMLFVSCSPSTEPEPTSMVHSSVKEVNVWVPISRVVPLWLENYIYVAPGLEVIEWSEENKNIVCSAAVRFQDFDFGSIPGTDPGIDPLDPLFFNSGYDSNHLLYTDGYNNLCEIDLTTYKQKVYLKNNSVFSAKYMPQSTRYIYFFSLGVGNTSKPMLPGYYLYDKETKKTELLFAHTNSVSGYNIEYVNGFDISPDGKKLLYPVVKYGYSPQAMEYDLQTREHKLLEVEFEQRKTVQCLWLRYNSKGDKILYSCYPPYGSVDSTRNESGVYDLVKKKKTILPLHTDNDLPITINHFPVWSPDDKHIVYESSVRVLHHMEYPELYSMGLFIFQNVEDYLREH